MRNFVIINGVNSNTINGLGINELPPITKPEMRNIREEIDGRDGDIITDLGYSAYDKTITIGLFGTGYDINDIVAFFNGEGTIVFSNEPDKYYNFKILNQIDYESLQKFRTASITFHCQPFKYPLTETPLEIEYDYIEDEDETLTLNNTADYGMELNLKGNTSQNTTTGRNMLNFTLPFSVSGEQNKFITPVPQLTVGQNYYFVGKCSDGTKLSASNCVFVWYNSTTSTSVKVVNPNVTYTAEDLSSANSFYVFLSSALAGKTITECMLVKGTYDSSNIPAYEPYTNGASPNPNYPQPVSVVSGDNDVVVCGKNIANLIRSASSYTGGGTQFTEYQYFINMARDSGVGSGVSLTSATTDTIVVKGRYNQGIGFPRKCKPNTYYSLQATSTSADARVYMSFFDSTGTFISGSASDTLMQRTQQSPANAYWVIPIFAVVGSSLVDTTFTNIMLEESNTINTYEPYQSQTYEVDLPVENLFDKTAITAGKSVSSSTGALYNDSNSFATDYINVKGIDNIVFNGKSSSNGVWGAYYDDNQQFVSGFSGNYTTLNVSSYSYVRFGILNTYLDTLQIEPGTKANSYTEYGTTPIELCKIGDYQDYFTKNSDGEWCKYNAIGKVVLNGSEGWFDWSNNRMVLATLNDYKKVDSSTTSLLMSNYYQAVSRANSQTNNSMCFYSSSDGSSGIIVCDGTNNTSALLKTWLSTHNTNVYYVLNTPYLSLIEDNNLITQLDNIQNATSYESTTNISQVNNDKAFIISAKALEDGTNEVVVNNIGNVYSKPLIALEGNGNVDIYLDNTQILRANVESKMNIDIAQLEAYNPDTMTLLNRQVIGNYNSMTLQSGNNTIRIDGALDKATITNYTRYL